MTRLKTALLCASALVTGSLHAFAQELPAPQQAQALAPSQAAQPASPLYDPAQLPVFKGEVELFTLTPRGDIDGFVMRDGTEVKTPPHLTSEVAFAIKPGDAVTIHGLKAAALPLIQATSVTDDASARTVVDDGPGGRNPPSPPRGAAPPPPPPPARGWLSRLWGNEPQMQGQIRMVLHGAQGEVNGALLRDGTILRFPPPEAALLSGDLQQNQTVFFTGRETSNSLGKIVDVTAFGTASNQMTPIGREPPPGRRGPPV